MTCKKRKQDIQDENRDKRNQRNSRRCTAQTNCLTQELSLEKKNSAWDIRTQAGP